MKGKNATEPEDAIACYSIAIQLKPDWSEPYLARAFKFIFYRKDVIQAMSDYSRVLQIDPSNDRAYGGKAFIYFNEGDFERAISNWNHSIEIDPNAAGAYYWRGLAHKEKGNLKLARSDFQRAAELDHDHEAAKRELEEMR